MENKYRLSSSVMRMRPQVVKNLVIVRFYFLILMHDKVTINYQLFSCFKKNYSETQKSRKVDAYLMIFRKKFEKWVEISLFQQIISFDA